MEAAIGLPVPAAPAAPRAESAPVPTDAANTPLLPAPIPENVPDLTADSGPGESGPAYTEDDDSTHFGVRTKHDNQAPKRHDRDDYETRELELDHQP